MKIIKPSARVLKHNVHPYQFIERVGRVCYKSEDKITEGSAERMVKNLVDRNHLAMLEHETIYLKMSNTFMRKMFEEVHREALHRGKPSDPFKFFNITDTRDVHILSGSFRSFLDLFAIGYISSTINYMQCGLQFMYPLVFGTFNKVSASGSYKNTDCGLFTREEFINAYFDRPEILSHHLTHTFLFVCDRGVTHEFVRHRVASFAQESTRYCNYSNGKFGGEITVIEPCFWERGSVEYNEWKSGCEYCEVKYNRLNELGAVPQQSRTVLPNSLKTELIITAVEEEWQHIIDLRYIGTTGAPHPQMYEVMSLAVEDLVAESEGRIVVVKGA